MLATIKETYQEENSPPSPLSPSGLMNNDGVLRMVESMALIFIHLSIELCNYNQQ